MSVQDDALLLYQSHSMGLDLAYRRLRGIKVSRVRMNVIWADAVADGQRELKKKPRRVRYDWARYDRAIRDARQRGVKVHLSLAGPAPAWATPAKTSERGHFKPNVRKFRKFVKAFARRYRGKVDRYSIWNEPNWRGWLGPPQKAPLLYRKLYRAGYKAIRRKSPRSRVLLGELAPYGQRRRAMAPLKFLRKMTCLDGRYRKKRRLSKRRCRGKLRADGVAHHPYDFDKPPWKKRPGRDNVTIANLGRLNKALAKLKRRRVLVPRRARKMPVHLTEYGYFRSGPRRISERKRARWTVKAYKIAKRTPHVKSMLYYVFAPPPNGVFDLSLVDVDGDKTRTWRKLRRWTRNNRVKRPERWRA